jgi:hypothetical protein
VNRISNGDQDEIHIYLYPEGQRLRGQEDEIRGLEDEARQVK